MNSDKASLPSAGVLRYFTLVCGVLLMVLILAGCGGGTTSKGTSSNQNSAENVSEAVVSLEESAGECGQCHAMRPEIATFQLTSHNKFECTVCHNVKASDYTETIPASPIKIKTTIGSDTCKQCHSANRAYSPSGDLIVPHERHDKAGVSCTDCHSGIAHANIAEREITTKEGFDDLAKWSLKIAEKVVTKYYSQPSMWTCIGCHKKKEITRACSACHTKISGLPSHESETWQRVHGITGRQNIGECTKCHSIPGEQKFVTPSTGDQAADFARANRFCYSCHIVKPKYHGNAMLSDHPEFAKERGLQNCLACHNSVEPKHSENIAPTFCNQCHWFKS